jgi:membrane-bound lytic murein transglycosylase D
MNYAADHALYPATPSISAFEVDTVHLSNPIHLKQIADYLEISLEELEFLNPMYKHSFIPESKNCKPLCLPVDKVGLYLTNEKDIHADIRRKEVEDSLAGKDAEQLIPESITHHVRSGEFLGYIANKYQCSVRDLMSWNNLRSTRINPGDKLTIFVKNKPSSTQTAEKQEVKEVKSDEIKTAQTSSSNTKYQMHTVKSGDTLWDIAKLYGDTTVNDLKRLNSDVNFRRLKPGMKVKVKVIS